MNSRDPRIDPQAGDEVRGVDGQLRSVIPGGRLAWCQDGVMRYRTTLQRWQERCVLADTAPRKEETEQ